MPELPPELLVLPPLAMAAGVDLYLTLLFLGAAPTTPWWEHPLPGALGDLDSLGVLVLVGSFYMLEYLAERVPPAGLVWNALHAILRPVSGALLALLVLSGQPTLLVVAGALLAAVLASLTHALRSGGAILAWLTPDPRAHPLLVSLLEDVLVIGLVALALDAPTYALGASAAGLALALPFAPSRSRAFAFAVRLASDRAFRTLMQRRWLGAEEIPGWVRRALEDDVLAPGGGLRGSPAGAHRLPGAPRFTTGWVVVRGGSPLFVFHRGSTAGVIDLGLLQAGHVTERGFFRRIDLTTSSGVAASLFFGLGGPGERSLRAEFLPD